MKYDLICIGMALVDSIIKGFDPEPVSASGYRAVSGSLNVGGEAVNESMAAAKLGLKTGIFCALGEDSAGAMVEHELLRSGVDTGLIVKPEGFATPVTTMFVRDDGTRRSITNTAHSRNFHPEKHLDSLDQTKAVILGSLFRAPFDDAEIIHAVVTAAKERDILVFADTKLPNYRFLTLKNIAPSLKYLDYITPNEDEASYYTGEKEPEKMAEVFLSSGIRNVIIKLGGRGCYFRNDSLSLRLPACPIEPMDATGAGDNFIAGFVSEILRGASAEEALAFANACGAICTTAVGAGTALKSREQVLEFMKKNGIIQQSDIKLSRSCRPEKRPGLRGTESGRRARFIKRFFF